MTSIKRALVHRCTFFVTAHVLNPKRPTPSGRWPCLGSRPCTAPQPSEAAPPEHGILKRPASSELWTHFVAEARAQGARWTAVDEGDGGTAAREAAAPRQTELKGGTKELERSGWNSENGRSGEVLEQRGIEEDGRSVNVFRG